ncbi:MAG: epoxyqueuosine reductase QueH [Clostridiales bacterium]|nr:epoxyqueuosine reductase QueH [Clostridiales bacterium]
MKLLLHTCCAPCSIQCIETLRGEGIEPTLFWYNPNIHPFTEYKMRKETLIDYAKQINASLIVRDEYGLRPFIEAVHADVENRCQVCYEMRLETAAAAAAEQGYDGFCTTLLISPYQNHELLCAVGEQMAERYGVSFVYRDFRPYFREGQNQARALGLYRQKYCGCIFSEEDRYCK